MEVSKLLIIMPKYEKCLKCGNDKVGNGQGKLIIEEGYYYRECRCGWSIKVDNEGKEINEN